MLCRTPHVLDEEARTAEFGRALGIASEVVDATQEQRDAWRKSMEPVYPQIVKETGGDAAAFYAAMEAGRKACAK